MRRLEDAPDMKEAINLLGDDVQVSGLSFTNATFDNI
jgi:hypothetical protein